MKSPVSASPFIPYIQQDVSLDSISPLINTLSITLAATGKDDLDWEKERALAEKACQKGYFLFWEIDLGLAAPFSPYDTAHFLSLTLALDHFTKTLYGQFQEQTVGLSLYRGAMDFSARFLKSENEEIYWKEWLEDFPFSSWEEKGSSFPSRLFYTNLFAEYLHRLASYLPDTLSVFSLFDGSLISSQAELAQLLSQERFSTLTLAVKHSTLPFKGLIWEQGGALDGWIGTTPPPLLSIQETLSSAICLPTDPFFSLEVCQKLDLLFQRMHTQKRPFRIIPEAVLTEEWEGIDHILVIEEGISPLGKRKLQGFSAAGGTVVVDGNRLGIKGEISLEDFLKDP